MIMAIQNAAASASDLSSLSQAADALARSARWWNAAYLILLGLTFLSSAFIVIKNNAHNRAQKALSEAKDRILKTELAAKDLEIGTAKRAAGEANKSAAEANERAEIARKETAEIYRKLGP